MSEIQYLEINDVTRIIKVPTNLLLGVMEDKDVERVYFKCKKIVGDNVDLSKHQLYVKYVNALDNSGKNFDVKTPGIYHCEDVVDHGDHITFSWLLSGNVFKKGGFVAFSVLASDGETTRWNTFPAIGTVLITIPGGLQEVEERYPDIITQLLNRMDEVEAMATPEAMQGYVNTYLAAHPAEIDPELLDPKKCAPANVVGELKKDLDDLTEPTKNKFTRDIIVSENGFEFKNNIISNNITDTKSYTAIKLYGKKDNVNVETYATNKELMIGNNVFYFNVKQDIDTLVFLHSGSARNLHFAFDVSKFIKRGYNSFSFTAESVNPSVENGVRLTKVQFENGGQTSYEYPYVSNDSVARREILEINKQILEINKHFENNLLNQKGKFPFKTEIFKNSVSNDNNYGSDNIRYRFTMPKYHKVHGFFEYQFTKAVPYRHDNTNVRLLSIGNNAVTANLYLNRPSVSNGYIYRSGMVLQENSYIGTTSKEFSVFTTNSFKGNDALYVRYIDSGTDVTMKIESGKITFKNGDTTLAVVSYSASDSIDSLIAKLKTLTFIEVGFVETTGKTCSDLLYDVTVPLTYTFDGTIDRPRVYVPYAYDDKWHTVEFIFDKDTMRSYVAFDGLTIESDVSDSAFGNIYDDYISIGGTFEELSESHIRLRNLEMDIDSYGDAEIVDSKASPYNAQKQLISSHNPRLLIYEGHGIDVRMDSDAIPSGSDDMACSTDRLMRVFEELTRKGYEPVTYEDIVDWKINGKPLPKRCFNLMFDDYRLENYLDDRKRFPFSKYNVKAGLAIISDSKDMSEEVTIDDTTYTVSEAFNAIKNGGWHPCSHTNTHTPIDDIMPSALPQKLKECIVSCNKHNLYSDVIVYPLGKVSTRSLSALENSDFSIGINIVTDRYNCRALPNMNLTRVEIGTREPIDKVLETIV